MNSENNNILPNNNSPDLKSKINDKIRLLEGVQSRFRRAGYLSLNIAHPLVDHPDVNFSSAELNHIVAKSKSGGVILTDQDIINGQVDEV